jgi:hypothetical protein
MSNDETPTQPPVGPQPTPSNTPASANPRTTLNTEQRGGGASHTTQQDHGDPRQTLNIVHKER